MKLSIATILASSIASASAFAPSDYGAYSRRSGVVAIGREGNVDLSGNTWKPDSEKMGVRGSLFERTHRFERIAASCPAACDCVMSWCWSSVRLTELLLREFDDDCLGIPASCELQAARLQAGQHPGRNSFATVLLRASDMQIHAIWPYVTAKERAFGRSECAIPISFGQCCKCSFEWMRQMFFTPPWNSHIIFILCTSLTIIHPLLNYHCRTHATTWLLSITQNQSAHFLCPHPNIYGSIFDPYRSPNTTI